jgi:FkbM family methyltransferase
MNMKSLINRLLLRDTNMLPNLCYGQDGEDLILNRLFDGKKNGYYVDVGAHHPVRFSNTYLFYKRGWRGINIDAMPGSMRMFNKIRGRDINIEIGVNEEAGVLKYYRFNEPALNTFDKAEAELKNTSPYRIVDSIEIPVVRLDSLLSKYLPEGVDIDFLSVDVEGKDLSVLRSNDWVKYRPSFILAETLRTDMVGLKACPLVSFLDGVGYKLICKAYNTSFFQKV